MNKMRWIHFTALGLILALPKVGFAQAPQELEENQVSTSENSTISNSLEQNAENSEKRDEAGEPKEENIPLLPQDAFSAHMASEIETTVQRTDENNESLTENTEPEYPNDAPVLWFDTKSTPPQWFSRKTTSPEARQIQAKLLSAGSALAIYQLNIGELKNDSINHNSIIIAFDKKSNSFVQLKTPKDAKNTSITWWGVDKTDKILAYDGENVWSAQNLEDAQKSDGYFKVFENISGKFIDIAGSYFISAADQEIRIIDFDTASQRVLTLAEILDSASPKSKKTKKKSKTQTNPENVTNLDQMQLLGMWWRHDGLGLVRIRQLLNTFAYITLDNGNTWKKFELELPTTLYRHGSWIWDGASQVLAKDGNSWISICQGASQNNYASFVLPTNIPKTLENSVIPAYNLPDFLTQPEAQTDSKAALTQPQATKECVTLEAQPQNETSFIYTHNAPTSLQSNPFLPTKQWGFWRRQELPKVTRITENNTEIISKVEPVSAVLLDFEQKTLTTENLPENCSPLFIDSIAGMDLLACDFSETEANIFVRSQSTDWTYEITLLKTSFDNYSLQVSNDGTLLIQSCKDDPLNKDPIDDICTLTVRKNGSVGEQNLWRTELFSNLRLASPLSRGEFLTITTNEDGSDALTYYTEEATEMRLPSFNSRQWDSYALTKNGCIAVHKHGKNSDYPEYLSQEGTITRSKCEKPQPKPAPVELEPVSTHDLRIGLRVSGGAFLATGIQTWMARAEVLFPISEGAYEFGGIFRIVGGHENKTDLGYAGFLAIRWVYDALQNWRFAIGAQVGYGHLCGATPKPEESNKPDDPEKPVDDPDKNPNPDPPNSTSEQSTPVPAICGNHAFRYGITGVASYAFSENWRIFIGADLLGGGGWGGDVHGGVEVRF